MPGAVCGHLLLVPLEGAPVNVSRPALPMQHRPRLQIAYEAPPAVRLARQPQASLLVPPAIDIGARIGWMTQHIGKGGAVRSILSHLPLARSGSDPVRQLDVVIDQIVQETIHRAASLEDGEDQPDR
jgi:hypothetical protein